MNVERRFHYFVINLLTEGGRGREGSGRGQFHPLLEGVQVDGRHLTPQQSHQLFHTSVVTLDLHQDLVLGVPPT